MQQSLLVGTYLIAVSSFDCCLACFWFKLLRNDEEEEEGEKLVGGLTLSSVLRRAFWARLVLPGFIDLERVRERKERKRESKRGNKERKVWLILVVSFGDASLLLNKL